MTYRIRKLSTSGPGVVDSPRNEATILGRAAGSVIALQTAVYEIEATALMLTSTEVEAMLENARLATTDLVFFDGGWMSIADCPDFAEAAVPHARREARQRTLNALRLLFFACIIVLWPVALRACQ